MSPLDAISTFEESGVIKCDSSVPVSNGVKQLGLTGLVTGGGWQDVRISFLAEEDQESHNITIATAGNNQNSDCYSSIDCFRCKDPKLGLFLDSNHEEQTMLHRALRILRTYHQLTQVELAKRIGISNSYLCEIESGEKSPTLELLEKYATVFKMPVSSIMLFSEKIQEPRKIGAKLRIFAAEKILRLLEWLEEQDAVKL